ncbi:MAG TPA: response regulator transcription factor [Nitrospira sp.]|nr:response regulator transcription factor [Nitrospira sp.]
MPKAKTIGVLLVDDHEVVRAGLRQVLSQNQGITVVGEAGTVAEAVREAVRTKPDVILMDARLPDGSGVDACRDIRERCPATRVLFLTSFSDESIVLAAVFGGADGYLLKHVDTASLLQAVRSVAEGHSILDASVTKVILNRARSLSAADPARTGAVLSMQQQRVLALVAKGKTNKEIAASLSLSDKTVKNYVRTIFQKLQVTRRSQAAAHFVRLGNQMSSDAGSSVGSGSQ